MYYLISAILLGAGAWLLIQGLKYSNRSRTIVGVAIITIALAIFGLMRLRGEVIGFESLGLDAQYWLSLGVTVGTVIAKASAAVAFILLFIWAMENRLIRRFTIVAVALGGTWWWAQNWSDFLVLINRVAQAIAGTVFG